MSLRRGTRVRVKLNSSFRHYLDGLKGTVTAVMHHAVIVALDSDPAARQRLIATAGKVGPDPVTMPQRIFPFHELEELP